MSHPESEWSQKADVLVNNSNGNLTTLDLTGYTGKISYGYHTGISRSAWVKNTAYALDDVVRPTTATNYQYRCIIAGTSHATTEPTWGIILGVAQTDGTVTWICEVSGDEYSACAPLEVIGQQQVTQFIQGQFYVLFSCEGVFDMMAKDEASAEYSPKDTNTDTCKTLLTAIANATMACFTHCKSYTITFEPISTDYPLGYDDGIINSFKPADYFRVSFRDSRLETFKKALEYTKCKARIGADGVIHVFIPTISGGTYNYEYNDAVTNHNFFEKSVRNRLVIPNRIYVKSHPDHSPQYTGNDTDSTSYASLGRYINEYHWLRLTSGTQADNIADAILQGYQVGQERGHGLAPLNCGQEVMDYVLITDSVANDTRIGNIGYLNRTVGAGKFEFEFRFGSLEFGGMSSLLPNLTSVEQAAFTLSQKYDLLYGAYGAVYDMLREVILQQQVIVTNLETIWNRERVAKLHVYEQLIIPVEL